MKIGTLIAGAAMAAAAAAGGGAIVVFGGLYDISAVDQHLPPTYAILDRALRQSVRLRTWRMEVPPQLDEPRWVARGLTHYREHCVQCHGAPGVAPHPFALGLTPAPANLVHTARHWDAAELFWVVKNGIKMTGMPAWKYRLSDEDIWATVAFMKAMPGYTPQQYRALVAPAVEADETALRPPDVSRGRLAIQQYLCVTCHAIPGIVGPNAPVGPPLAGIATRRFIAGHLPNEPGNMVRWLRQPQQLNPESAMPDLGVTQQDALDITAYLATLH